jgi:hypothetical protein
MTPEIRKHLSSSYWQKLRKRRIEFDGKKCQVCNRTTNLEVHHFSYENCGTEDEFGDLITLCCSCHKLEHARLNNFNENQFSLFDIIDRKPLTVLQVNFQVAKEEKFNSKLLAYSQTKHTKIQILT